MHRHGYQGRKLSRQRDQRQALVRGQITSLILYEQTATTLAKAKELAPQFDRLVTKARTGTLAATRAVHAEVGSNAARKLLVELVPAFGDRTSGFSRLTKLPNRRGDNAPMAMVSLILPAKTDKPTAKATETSQAEAPADAKPAESKSQPKAPSAKTKSATKAGAKA